MIESEFWSRFIFTANIDVFKIARQIVNRLTFPIGVYLIEAEENFDFKLSRLL